MEIWKIDGKLMGIIDGKGVQENWWKTTGMVVDTRGNVGASLLPAEKVGPSQKGWSVELFLEKVGASLHLDAPTFRHFSGPHDAPTFSSTMHDAPTFDAPTLSPFL